MKDKPKGFWLDVFKRSAKKLKDAPSLSGDTAYKLALLEAEEAAPQTDWLSLAGRLANQ